MALPAAAIMNFGEMQGQLSSSSRTRLSILAWHGFDKAMRFQRKSVSVRAPKLDLIMSLIQIISV